MDDDGLPNARPIALSDSARCQRSQSSVFSAAVKPRKYPRPIAVHSFPFQDRVLRRPVETTALSGHALALLRCLLLRVERISLTPAGTGGLISPRPRTPSIAGEGYSLGFR